MSTISLDSRVGIDWIALTVYLALVLIGGLMIYSSSVDGEQSLQVFNLSTLIGKHTIWIFISLFVFICTLFIDWKFWDTFSYVFYVIGIVSLIAVLIFGVEIKGARSWFSFFGFSFQPAETAKFFTCLALSSFLSSYKTDLGTIRSQVTAIALFFVPAFLILLQSDAGSAIVFMSFFIVLYRAGLSPIYYIIGFSLIGIFAFSLMFGPISVAFTLLILGSGILALNYRDKWVIIAVLSLFLIFAFIFIPQSIFIYGLGAAALILFTLTFIRWDGRNIQNYALLFGVLLVAIAFSYGSNFAFESFLEPHQQDRINVWLRPQVCDPQGSLYNIIQSKLAIGSGGFSGKGFLAGDMTKLNYVPEQSSDFIFSIIGEEQGFIGVISVIVLFILLLYRIILIAERAKSSFVRHYAYGLAGILFVHYFINIGMTLGIMPVIGIPLPFLSQGGSALLSFSIMIGVLIRMDLSR